MNTHNATLPRKVVVAFFLGLLSFLLIFLLGEVFGDYALFIGMGVYFLVAQYLLSRGNPQAIRKDWPLITAMNFTPLCATIIALAVEPNKGNALEMLLVTILTLACSYTGAALAARVARRRLP
jgi:hypothetical protein